MQLVVFGRRFCQPGAGVARGAKPAVTRRFAKMPLETFTDTRLTRRELRVLGVIVAHANKADEAWPKRETIAKLVRTSARKVSEATSNLQRYGWLEKRGSGGRSKPSVYRITVPDTGRVSDAETVPESGTKTLPVLDETLPESGTKTLPPVGQGHRTDHEQTNRTDHEQGTAPPVTMLTLRNGNRFPVTEAMAGVWQSQYPQLDVTQELMKMAAWLDANPKRRKTERGIKAFCVNWLNRSQAAIDRGFPNGLSLVEQARRQRAVKRRGITNPDDPLLAYDLRDPDD